jgi:integrase
VYHPAVMAGDSDMADGSQRNVERLVLPRVGRLRESEEITAGVEVLDVAGEPISPITDYLRHITANDRSRATCRSYAMALLRWWRFLSAIDVPWQRAGQIEYVDHILWMRMATPTHGGAVSPTSGFAPRTINHASAVLSEFYEYHKQNGTGPAVNPTSGFGPRQQAHHNPMQQFLRGNRKLGRQKIPFEAPRSVPDRATDELFVKLRYERDRALIALFLSTGARATELLTVVGGGLDFGNQRIRVSRKGGRGEQWLPASPDAFVWLRLYLGQRRIAAGDPVWLTLRKPDRPLEYAACRRVFERAQRELGTTYTLHQLRHTTAYRMMEDPNVSITDVQWILGHSSLTSTQIYARARPEEVLERIATHHRRARPDFSMLPAASGYDAASLATLFGQ